MRALVGTILLVLTLSIPRAFAQADPPEAGAPDLSSREFSPETYPIADLRAETMPLRRADLEEFASLWFGHLQRAVAAEAEAIRDGSPGAVAEAERRRSSIADRFGLVLNSLEAKGGDAEEYRKYLSAVSEVRVESPPQAIDPVAPSEYPLRRLAAEVRPMRVDDLEQLADRWTEHLRLAVAEESEAALGAGDGSQSLAAAEARRSAVVERLNIIINSIEAKGGDAASYRAYVAAVSGVQLDWLDFDAVSGYIRDWVVSPDGGIEVLVNIAQFIVILIAFWFTARIAAAAVRSAVGRMPGTSELLRDFLVGGTSRMVLLIGGVVAVSFLGVNVTPLLAAIGAAGLVIGLALQGTLSNFASGVLILIYRPYDVGDVIDAGGISGKVEAMNLVSTRILTYDNKVHIVPNNTIWNGVITNITGRDTRRVDLTFAIAYGEDISKAMDIIAGVFKDYPLILEEPAPNIRVGSLGEHSVNIIARPWAKTSDYWDVYWDCMRLVRERFDAAGIGIPFSRRDVQLPETLRVVVANN